MTTGTAIRIEGGLLGPEILEQVTAGSLPGQKSTDFGLDARRNLTDEIASLFADAQSLWGVFQRRLNRLTESDAGTSATRDLWMIPLLKLLGYEIVYNSKAYAVDGLTFAVSHRAGNGEDAPPVHLVGARQDLGRVPASGRPRLSPHALVQEYLNRTEHLWGLVANGFTLRLLRDSTFVRRQSYVEFDLAAIFDEQRFQDFVVLYRLLHRSRLPFGVSDGETCWIERYYQQSVEQGGRVREHLREGVERCLQELADGFLRASERLRTAVAGPKPEVSADRLYKELLRLVYRFLFLLVSEDRGLISADPVYRDHYGVSRLRRLVDVPGAYTEDDDLWQSLRVLWKVLSEERLAAYLGAAPLNGELFSPIFLDDCTISNRSLLEAIWRLAWYRESDTSSARRVNYAALDVEELGSVYESLLEFHPAVESDGVGGWRFRLRFGSERKTTGSYYTPPQLVNELVSSALEPVMRQRLASVASNDREKALLSLRVLDPACGSGHFLLAAARRMAKELACIRTGEQEPAPERVREATRDVIAHCIYGVDKNPLAVDLCRVALWLEGHLAGKPLTFLDHRIRCGDSLVGAFDVRAIEKGIPDEAFKPLEGDDRMTAREAANRNRSERNSQLKLDGPSWEEMQAQSGLKSLELERLSDDTPEAVREKKRRFEAGKVDPNWCRQKEACDLWTAAFFQPLLPEKAPIITTGSLQENLAGRQVDARILAKAGVMAERERFFHWLLEFPEVFAAGGFDVVLSNPPWERIKLQEQEFFAARNIDIVEAPTKAIRARMIQDLQQTQPELFDEYRQALRSASAVSSFLRYGGRFPLTGRGDINTYAVFAELARRAVRPGGRSGIIVPSGIATDDTTKFFFQDLIDTGSLVSLYDFENRRKIFQAVDSRMKFALLTMQRAPDHLVNHTAEFAFFALCIEDIRQEGKRFTLSAQDIELLNPNTRNCPIFRSRADAELTKAIYRRVPVLWREARDGKPEENPWRLSFNRMFDMANDSHHFRTSEDLQREGYRREGNVYVRPERGSGDRYLPLYEAKMVHQFDHRWATYDDTQTVRDVTEAEKRDPNFVVQPRYWVHGDEVDAAIPKYPEALAAAVRSGGFDGIRQVFTLWMAGHAWMEGDEVKAKELIDQVMMHGLPREVSRVLPTGDYPDQAIALARDYPLDLDTRKRVTAWIDKTSDETGSMIALARELVDRFSPKWFIGWRDITNATNERTTIASVLIRSAVGDTFLLMFPGISDKRLCMVLIEVLNSLVQDYSARQKIGGTHMKYNVFRQLPVPSPSTLKKNCDWYFKRAIELVYNTYELKPLAVECGYSGKVFPWDPDRRFEIRCELDAAFFHLYLPATSAGDWKPARVADGAVVDETPEELAALKRHFPRPRDAVAYILDQFPIVRQKEEAAYGHFRTRERILAIYDDMQASMAEGRPFRSTLNPPPGYREEPQTL